jgi:hypothetical protein
LLKVFVSSTWEDLQPERAAVERVLAGFENAKFIGMEYSGAIAEDTLQSSLDRVDRCDLFLLILGYREGSGIVEAEYRQAREKGLPCLVYAKQADDPDDLPPLEKELRRNHTLYTFNDVTELAIQVSADLHRECARLLTPGLESAVISAQPVFERVRLDSFVGREWLRAQVDDFIEENDRGYLVIEAPAGLGKTTFAAHMAQERGYPHHFVELEPGEPGVGVGLMNLAVQILRSAPDSVKRPWLRRVQSREQLGPRHFEELLRDLAETLSAGSPAILIVDALDQAGLAGRRNPMGLPVDLPAHVFIICTQRPGPVLETSAPKLVVPVEGENEDNLKDLGDYLAAAARWPGVQRALQGGRRGGVNHRYTEDEFVDALRSKSRGVWIYARYVLAEIEEGARSPLDLDTLPAGVWDYYARYWDDWRSKHHAEWYEDHLPLLGALAAIQRAMPFETVCELVEIGPRPATRALLDREWRAFVFAQEARSTRNYRLYHASLNEFVAGKFDTEGLEQGRVALIEEMRDVTIRAHDRIASSYLSLWGGLPEGLPELSDPTKRDAHAGYGLRHTAHHLSEAGRQKDLYRLIHTGRCIDEKREENTWFATHDAVADVDGFVADVRLGLDRVLARLKLAPSAIKPDALAIAAHYGLILSSIGARASAVPPELLACLVASEAWSLERAYSHTTRANEFQRIEGLAYLAEVAPHARSKQLVAEALELALKAEEGYRLCKVFDLLARHLNNRDRSKLLTRALPALALEAHGLRARSFERLAPWLKAREARKYGDELAVYYTSADMQLAGGALGISVWAGKESRELLIDRAIRDCELGTPLTSSWQIANLFKDADEEAQKRILEAAVTRFGKYPDIWYLFTMGARHLTPGAASRLWHACQAWPLKKGNGYRRVLNDMAWRLPPEEARVCAEQLEWIESETARKRVAEALLARSQTLTARRANKAWRSAFDYWMSGGVSLESVLDRASQLTKQDWRRAMGQLLDAVSGDSNEDDRSETFRILCAALYERKNQVDADLAERIAGALERIGDGPYRLAALSALATRSQVETRETLIKLHTRDLDPYRAEPVSHFSGLSLARLALNLTPSQRRQVVSSLLEAEGLGVDELGAAAGVLGRAAHPEDRRSLWEGLVDQWTYLMTDDRLQGDLTQDLPAFTWALKKPFDAQLCATFEDLVNESDQAYAIWWSGRHVSRNVLPELESLAATIEDDALRALALATLVPRGLRARSRARELLESFDESSSFVRAAVLGAVAVALPEAERPEIAFEVVVRCSDGLPVNDGTRILMDCSKAFTGRERRALLLRALSSALDLTTELAGIRRVWYFQGLLELPETERRLLAGAAVEKISTLEREQALVAFERLAPLFGSVGGDRLTKALFRQVYRVGEWWP